MFFNELNQLMINPLTLIPSVKTWLNKSWLNKKSAALFEQSINRILTLDVEAYPKLQVFSGKVIHINIVDLELDYYLLFPQGNLIIQSETNQKACASISGRLSDFMAAAIQENSGDAVFTGDIHFSGEVKTAKLFQDFIASLNIDWAEPLSQLFGDPIAHNLTKSFKYFTHTMKHWAEQTQQDIPEYLQHEISVTPVECEVDDFLQNVDQLRAQTDRLQARVDRLKPLDRLKR